MVSFCNAKTALNYDYIQRQNVQKLVIFFLSKKPLLQIWLSSTIANMTLMLIGKNFTMDSRCKPRRMHRFICIFHCAVSYNEQILHREHTVFC
jgi:hypothetical protein